MAERLRILFVDDESEVLSGLRRSMRSMRREWTMQFASSGEDALVLLEEEPIDVIVSDMKMPGMDGSELLGRVRQEYPDLVRIVLSGYADKEMVLDSIGSAHQYLSKPCDADSLKSAVNRAITMKETLQDTSLRKIVNRLQTIPSLPTTYSELTAELNSNYPKSRRLGQIIRKDPGMTAKVLQLVNSAFFSLRRTVSDPTRAVDLLGTETISSLVLALGVFSHFKKRKYAKIFDQTMEHSLEVAELAKKIGHSSDPEFVSQAFTVGLLHEIGTLIFMNCLPEEYAAIRKKCAAEGIPIAQAEEEAFGANHAQIGGYLLSLWGLPVPVVEAVTFHLNPGTHGESEFSCLAALHVANAICDSFDAGQSESINDACDVEFLKSIDQYETAVKWHAEYWREKTEIQPVGSW